MSYSAPGKVSGNKFPKSSRILKNSEFTTIQKRSKRVYSRNFTALLYKAEKKIPKSAGYTARIGITISKKVQKLAVKRNRVKRIIREAFREIKSLCPANLCLVIVAKSSCANLTSREFKEELFSLLKSQNMLAGNQN